MHSTVKASEASASKNIWCSHPWSPFHKLCGPEFRSRKRNSLVGIYEVKDERNWDETSYGEVPGAPQLYPRTTPSNLRIRGFEGQKAIVQQFIELG